jgi:L-fuculose-phosphate aldolase
VVVGPTLRAATVLAHALERACRIQVMAAMLPGIPHSVASSEDVERKRSYIYSDTSIKAFWDYCVRTVERNSAEVSQWKTR